MADRINFSQEINVSVQVGDDLYFTNLNPQASQPIKIGPIIEVGSDFVVVDGPDPTPVGFSTPLFFMFKKPDFNNASVKGYFAEARMATKSNSKIELFTLGSEITQSSK